MGSRDAAIRPDARPTPPYAVPHRKERRIVQRRKDHIKASRWGIRSPHSRQPIENVCANRKKRIICDGWAIA
jgi:hypothetical protein